MAGSNMKNQISNEFEFRPDSTTDWSSLPLNIWKNPRNCKMFKQHVVVNYLVDSLGERSIAATSETAWPTKTKLMRGFHE